MKEFNCIYQEKNHKWIVLHRDLERDENIVDTNECLIVYNDEILITDPGGMEVFPSIFTAISKEYNPEQIKSIFASHQDPDIISSYPLWLSINPNIKVYISNLWKNFITHFGGTMKNIEPIPDPGKNIDFNGLELHFIPAHYLHSSGNFNLYDPVARILFSGDIGTALGNQEAGLYVHDFDQHIQFAKGFHQRYIGSDEARTIWCDRVSKMDIDIMIPQHGSIYKGEHVARFIEWFRALEVGKAY